MRALRMVPFIQALEEAALIYGDKTLEWWLPLTLAEIEQTGGNSLGNKNVLYLVSSIGVIGVHICQDSSDHIHKLSIC